MNSLSIARASTGGLLREAIDIDDLDLFQQIAYLEPVLGRLLFEYKVDCYGNTVLSEDLENIELYLSNLDALRFEREIEELIISEAEEIAWDYLGRPDV